METQTKNTMLFIITPKTLKYLGKNLTNMCRMCMLKLQNIGESIQRSKWMERHTVCVNWKSQQGKDVLLKLFNRFNVIPVKVPVKCFCRLYFHLYGKIKGTRIVKTILKKDQSRRNYPISWLILIAVVIKTMWFWWKDRHRGQWDRIENPEIDPHNYAQLTFDKTAQAIQWRNYSLFNKRCWSNWSSKGKTMNSTLNLIPY